MRTPQAIQSEADQVMRELASARITFARAEAALLVRFGALDDEMRAVQAEPTRSADALRERVRVLEDKLAKAGTP